MNGQLIHENHRRVVLGACVLRYAAKPPKIQPSARHRTLYYSKSTALHRHTDTQTLSLCLSLSDCLLLPRPDNNLFKRAAYANKRRTLATI